MFKDYIADDIEKVFLNLSEFADEVLIDGKRIKVVLDNESRSYKSNVEEMERSVGNIMIFANKETWQNTFNRLPQAFDALMFNNRPCTVIRATERNGMLNITLDYGA